MGATSDFVRKNNHPKMIPGKKVTIDNTLFVRITWASANIPAENIMVKYVCSHRYLEFVVTNIWCIVLCKYPRKNISSATAIYIT